MQIYETIVQRYLFLWEFYWGENSSQSAYKKNKYIYKQYHFLCISKMMYNKFVIIFMLVLSCDGSIIGCFDLAYSKNYSFHSVKSIGYCKSICDSEEKGTVIGYRKNHLYVSYSSFYNIHIKSWNVFQKSIHYSLKTHKNVAFQIKLKMFLFFFSLKDKIAFALLIWSIKDSNTR